MPAAEMARLQRSNCSLWTEKAENGRSAANAALARPLIIAQGMKTSTLFNRFAASFVVLSAVGMAT
ncbi:MAG: hypothetical protein AAFV29_25115, partial [Myxococcota bacterium]